jgi:hypothetical protein
VAQPQTEAECMEHVQAITYDSSVDERMVLARLWAQGKITIGDIRDAVESY